MHWYSLPTETDSRPRIIRRLNRLFLLLKEPRDVWLSLQIIAWALALPFLKRAIPLKVLTRWMWVDAKTTGTVEQQKKIGILVRWIYIFVFRGDGHCLERSLLLYRFLSRSKIDARLVTGMKRAEDQENWKGHAWITVDGRPFEEPETSVQNFKCFMIFGPEGVMTSLHDQ